MKRIFWLCTVLTLTGCSSRLLSQKAGAVTEMPSVASINNDSGDLNSFERVIVSTKVQSKGLFNIYRSGEKYYWEIPDSMLNREMLAVTRMVKAPAGLTQIMHQYGGEQLNQQIWKWTRHKDQIFLKVENYSLRGGSEGQMQQAVSNSNMETILAAFPIKAKSKNGHGILIEVSSFFSGDAPSTGVTVSMRNAYKITELDNSRSFIDTMKCFPLNIEISVVKTYRATGSPTEQSNGAMTFEMNTSMLLLPKTPAKPRLYDGRVSFISNEFTDYGTDAQQSVVTSYIHRWKLEPKDTAAYGRGELVEPKKQIIFYIDPATPKKWIPYLIQGVNDWQKAFEAAGFKNAIVGKEAPTPTEDPDFSTEDARYSVIRYYASDQENAYGPHVADPRSGEIIESHIGWFYNQMKELHDWYLIQKGAANPIARSARYSDELMGELIRYTCSHEVGHTLGFPHNWGSSSAYPVDSLRSPSFTKTHGTAPSIMDYSRFNYIAQPGDGVTHFSPKVGEYDLWAIKWGYSWFSGNKSPEKEKKILDCWVTENAKNQLYFYGDESVGYDPRIQTEDIGDDAMKAGVYGIANLKRELPLLETWTAGKGSTYNNLKDYYNQIISQYNTYLSHVITYIGGIYMTGKTEDQKGAAYIFVERKKQLEALAFLESEAFTTPGWLLDTAELNKFDDGLIPERIRSVQSGVLKGLLEPQRLARLYNAQITSKSNVFTAEELLHNLHLALFRPNPDAFERSLQREYIFLLADLLKSSYRFDPAHDQTSHGNTSVDLNLSDIKPVVRAELMNLKHKMPTAGDVMLVQHYKDLSSRISKVLLN